MGVTYSPHFKDHVEGHLFFDVPEGEPCTITLQPAASADQEWLNVRGQRIAKLLSLSDDEIEAIAEAVDLANELVEYDESEHDKDVAENAREATMKLTAVRRA